MFPMCRVARAVSVCVPFAVAVVSHVGRVRRGGVVGAEGVPVEQELDARDCDVVASCSPVTVTEPDTEPPVGAVIATVRRCRVAGPGVGVERDELHDPRVAVLGCRARRRTRSSSRRDPRCGCRRRWSVSCSRFRLG